MDFPNVKILRKHILVLLFLLIYFSFFAVKLIQNPAPFYDWDEVIYAQVGREMVQKPSLIPLWQGQYWLDKPPLVPLFYGVVAKTFFFIQPEISTRIATLIITLITLSLIYLLYNRVMKNCILSTTVVAITAFTPIFLQRAQVLNIDIFVLLGWVGYILFFQNFWIGFIFLTIAVMSKSLIGFYPVAIVGIYYLYLFFRKKINRKELTNNLKTLLLQTGILLVWYLIMIALFRMDFIIKHIYESHFKRVTSSLEYHFGKRTYYLDLIFLQYGRYTFLSIVGIVVIAYQYLKGKLEEQKLLYALYLLPWFIFLNATKTKIFWYAHPAVPQFAFLMVYPITFVNKKMLSTVIGLLVLGLILYQNILVQPFYAANYSGNNEPHYKMAEKIKQNCSMSYIFISQTGRKDFRTLASLNNLISTSKWWGNHPSIVYYAEKPIHFIYEDNEMIQNIKRIAAQQCLAMDKSDIKTYPQLKEFTELGIFGDYYLYEKQ